MQITFKFDGACNNNQEGGNPDMGVGCAVFVDNVFDEALSTYKGYKGDEESSSNIAEWKGCVEAFRLASEYMEAGDVIQIYSDSQLISRQYNGDYEIKQDKFKKYYNEARELAVNAGLGNLKIQWVKREFNKEADKLSKIALQAVSGGKTKKV